MTKTPYLTLYYNWAHILSEFTDAEYGRLMKAIVAYSEGSTEQPKLSRPLMIAYRFITDTIDRSEIKAAKFENTPSEQKKSKKSISRPTNSTKKKEKTLSDFTEAIETENNAHKLPTSKQENDLQEATAPTEQKKADEPKQDSPTHDGFTSPSLDEVRELFKSRNYKSNPDEFYNFYESKGWLVGQSPMRNWQASAANWEIKVIRERIESKGCMTSDDQPTETHRYGTFDVHEAFKKALERSYGKAAMLDDDDDD